jgi:hypothetical protein
VEVFCYALSPSDGSEWRLRIEAEAEHFLDVSAWSVADIARKISADGIHVAVNLNGYTKGARNEIFALCPAPVQTSYMGFPATTGAAPLLSLEFLLRAFLISMLVSLDRAIVSGRPMTSVVYGGSNAGCFTPEN